MKKLATACLYTAAAISITASPVVAANVTLTDGSPYTAQYTYNVDAGEGSEFANEIDRYLADKEISKENYVISPLSLREVMCLAIAGADGQTQKELLQASCFESEEEARNWSQHIRQIVKTFKNALQIANSGVQIYGGKAEERSLLTANSIWDNTSRKGDFTQWYKDHVSNEYGADIREASAETITDEINSWCKEKTEGMIPSITSDASQCAAVLANALYVKTEWEDSFKEDNTRDDIFTTLDNRQVTVPFMETTAEMPYYQDENTSLVVLEMKGGIQFVCVMGDTDHIEEKLAQTEEHEVHIRMPKFTVASMFDSSTINDMLRSFGVNLAFDPEQAEFSKMCNNVPWYIDEILQKAKFEANEQGVKAAAVTAVEITDSLALEPDLPLEFLANKPFSFRLYFGLGLPEQELLFCGQITDASLSEGD